MVDLDGRLIGAGASALYQTIADLLSRGVTQIVINMDGVDLMDSSGLGELSRVKKAADARSGTIKLLHVAPSVRQVLQMSGAIGTFEIFDVEVDAISSFRG